MKEDQPTYRFKWSNHTLESFVSSRHAAARALRGEASVLLKRADQIEIEIGEWQESLVPVTAPAKASGDA